MQINWVAGVLLTGGVLAGGALADSIGGVPYPQDYRNWTVTRSYVAGPESKVSGFHHYYANPKALEGFASGKFPDGAIIVDERLAAEQRDGGTFEGKRLYVAVMEKDSRRYAETGGWGFDVGLGENQELGAGADTRGACYSCHSKQKDRDFVFSSRR